MQDNKKKRLSMLDHLVVSSPSAPAAPPAPASMMSTNRALRSARDAVDSHRVWELDPGQIEDSRFRDRLDPKDVADLRASIEANGQTVPILVRRHPEQADRYLLVYGRRRLEAIRTSDKVMRVRALIASLDDGAALRAQVAENTARRDLSYIERALFAKELQESGFGNQNQIAEVLNTTKSAISMALSVANGISTELIRAIGPAHSIGRPRWEALIAAIAANHPSEDSLIAAAVRAHAETDEEITDEPRDSSTDAFQSVLKLASRAPKAAESGVTAARAQKLKLGGKVIGDVKRTAKGLRLEVKAAEPEFVTWMEDNAQSLMETAYARFKNKG